MPLLHLKEMDHLFLEEMQHVEVVVLLPELDTLQFAEIIMHSQHSKMMVLFLYDELPVAEVITGQQILDL